MYFYYTYFAEKTIWFDYEYESNVVGQKVILLPYNLIFAIIIIVLDVYMFAIFQLSQNLLKNSIF